MYCKVNKIIEMINIFKYFLTLKQFYLLGYLNSIKLKMNRKSHTIFTIWHKKKHTYFENTIISKSITNVLKYDINN